MGPEGKMVPKHVWETWITLSNFVIVFQEEAAEDRDLRVEAEATELLKRPLTLYTVHPLPPLALLWPAMGRLCPLTGSKTNFPLTAVGRVVAPLPPTLCPFTFPARIKLTIIIITITSLPMLSQLTYAKAIFISALFITSVIISILLFSVLLFPFLLLKKFKIKRTRLDWIISSEILNKSSSFVCIAFYWRSYLLANASSASQQPQLFSQRFHAARCKASFVDEAAVASSEATATSYCKILSLALQQG